MSQSRIHLPYDYARCHGGTAQVCVECLRRTAPWRPAEIGGQSVLASPPSSGESCGFFIAPRMAD